MKNIVILISGRGSNMEAIIRAAVAEKWPARIAAVISNRADAGGLRTAELAGIPVAIVEHSNFPDRVSFDRALAEQIDGFQPDLVVLAGFMRILSAGFVEHYRGYLLNIHPSLLPSFPGLSTHRRAIEAGVRFHGATVHFVTQTLDHGPIVEQAVVPVFEDDVEETLAQRVLAEEHRIYPAAVRGIVEGRIRLDGEHVRRSAPVAD
ncbi:MAG: phosphoribosylglycinamide formyltransferase [Oxalobacteraceae bacterium]|nr:phosphoribosylglycinamide formyltransferase [Oxalobacteraceae bacterium]